MADLEVPGKVPLIPDTDAPYCQLCIEGGECVLAEAYCTIDKEFLCSGCSNAHRRSKTTRNHPLLDKENMPSKVGVEEVHENISEYCEKHSRELIKYFCPEHQSLLCGDCIAFDAHTCKVKAIGNVSKSFIDSSVYKDIKSHINKLADNACKTTAALEKKGIDIDNSERKDKDEVGDFQSHVIACLNEKFQKLTSQITATSQEFKVKLIHLQERSKATEAEATRLKADMEENESNNVLLFISAHRAQQRANLIPDKLHRIEEEIGKIPTYEFTPSSKFNEALNGSNSIGIYRSSADTHEHGSDEICSGDHKGSITHIV